MKYYSLKNILKQNADYNIIVGERSNGKTYACLQYIIENAMRGNKSVYLRRWKEDLTIKRMSTLFSAFDVAKMTKGKYTEIVYKGGVFYFANKSEKDTVIIGELFCFAVALSDTEHNKSVNFENANTIVFDEFLTRQAYIRDEFILFMNSISTIIRNNNNVKIFMLGNTVNTYSPYFDEMGLLNIGKQKQGTIDVYRYGNDNLTVAVEYCENLANSKKSNKYFAFNNPRLEMIKGGKWELGNYRHLPTEYKVDLKKSIFYFVIGFNNELARIDFISDENDLFLYVTRKTTEIKDNIVYYNLQNNKPSCYHRTNLLTDTLDVANRIRNLFRIGKVYYSDNRLGELVKNYLECCKK